MALQTEGLLDIKPNHLFRYASEWDPREPGHTKGGYLEGRLNLPINFGDLRVVFSTVADTPLKLDLQITQKYPESSEVHPTLLYVVRKGKGNRRMNEREPVPNHHHWRQEFHIVDRCVRIKNRTSDADLKRYDKMEELPVMDDVFMLGSDMVLHIGKGSGELNLIILIPKTEARSFDDEVTINKIISDRMPDPEAMQSILFNYKKKTSTNIKKLRIKVEIFSLESNLLICSGLSSPICDTASKEHGAMDFAEATPLRSCSKGGRKVVMVAESQIAKDVEPKFLLFDQNGKRLEEMDKILIQPNDSRNPTDINVSVLKETIIFITPPQPNIEMIMKNGWLIKLAGVRKSDGFESSKKFNFNYVPDDFYDPCIFCELKPDGNTGKAVLPSPIGPARPGVKKRRMPESAKGKEHTNSKKFITKELTNTSPPSFRFGKLPSSEDSLSSNLPALDKLLGCTPSKPAKASKPPSGSLKLKPISALQRTYTTSQADELMTDAEKDIPSLVFKKTFASMPDLIDLQQLKSLQNLQSINQSKQVSLKHKSVFSESEKEAAFRAALQKAVNKQPRSEPTMLEKLLLKPNSNEESEKTLPFLIKLEENAFQSPCLYPSFQKEKSEKSNSKLIMEVTEPYVIKLEPEEEKMEPETTRPDLTPNSGPNISLINRPSLEPHSSETPDTTSQDPVKIKTEDNPVSLPKQTIEDLLKNFQTSQTVRTFPINLQPIQESKLRKITSPVPRTSIFRQSSFTPPNTLTSSNIEMIQHQLSPQYQAELDNLDNLDILDKIFQPLPPTLNDSLQTNYNYASIGKEII
eukprot:GFUD01000928.1.p1 GENE.GFUD01000928.1~~GFUD01000928.1.p1  ORF type:complete len:806 (-),score=155.07 GFUD01000928.1:82-2499(-)